MEKLSDQKIITIMREEWAARKASVLSETKEVFQTASPGLKVKTKKTGVLYTVVKVVPGAITIADPEGKIVTLANADLEDDFELA
jgi:hypothetical protein